MIRLPRTPVDQVVGWIPWARIEHIRVRSKLEWTNTQQKDPPSPLEKGAEPNGAQILAAMGSSRYAMQTPIAPMAVDVNLLRADLRVVAERSVSTEKQVKCLQSEMDTLKASVAILEAKPHKLEARVEDAGEAL
ncbi:hypothetical protein NDU88_001611 [Pleurodeles waltl]|uniref:Uncharacterized protein n=1 Tax=Pleurodeles waltl TaxID=8319 RepID=A0AAV7KSF2_PLEWA|nr:hypothetical protein NDU88_001611 [Pleurodeles waltl]